VRAVLQLAGSLQRRLAVDAAGGPREPGALLSLAFPDRIGRRRAQGRGRYLLANGRGAVMPEDDPLADSEWLVVASLDAGRREGRIWSALPISRAALEVVQAEHVIEEDQLAWDEGRQGVVARRVRRLGAITLAENVSSPQDQDAAQAVLLQELVRRWPEGLPWNAAAAQYRARIQRMAGLQPCAWPDVSDTALQADMGAWLGPWLGGRLRLAQLADLDLVACLQGLLDWPQQQQLDAWLPSHYTSPAGSRRRIDYLAEGPPRCAVPLQEVFGQAASPKLAEGRVPLVLELLNPAGRPLQVTADLANFWAGAYNEVRKELRGRYPKHDWPEDPAAAPARRGTGRPRRG
jgi:ATP-dependent helicase HrpB